MTARLILRGCRLMVASASSQPLPATVLSECVRSCQVAPTFLPRASLHISPLRSLADSLAEASQEPSTETYEEFHSLLVSAQTVDELLKIASTHQINGNKSCMVICEISKRNAHDKKELLNDQRFQRLLKEANGEIQTIFNKNLVVLLNCLNRLGLDKQNQYLQSAEMEVRWRLRRLSINHLAQLSTLSRVDSLRLDGSLDVDLAKQVELRWTEIKETKTLVVLLSRLGHMSKALVERLEDKVLEFAEQFTPGQIKKIMLALASQERRSLPVLRALSFYLAKHPQELSPPIILSLIYSFAKLNFCQPELLERMAKDITPKLPELTSVEISNLVRSLSLLKFSSVPLFEAITQTCLERRDSFSPSQLCYILLNFANLNFHPSEEFFSLFHQRVVPEMKSLPLNLQLDVVFSLCILRHATTPYLQRVLEPQFYNKILVEKCPKSGSRCGKLLQINSSAQLECSDYRGPLLPSEIQQNLMRKVKPQGSSNLQKNVQDMLKIIYPESGACRFNVLTVYGYHIDCEVILDSEYNALPLKDFEASHCAQSEGTQPLPEWAKRLSIVCRDFPSFRFHSKDLLGKFAMNRRHLQEAGFLVMEVPYYDWQEQKSDWLKQIYLKDHIKKLVSEGMAQ